MAKNNNLKDFVTDIADAIREKKGTTEKINPQDFSDEIRGIESGGGDAVVGEDLNFIDNTGEGFRLLGNVVVEEGVTLLQAGAYQSSGIKSISLPSSLVRLNDSCFNNCKKLKKIHIPDSVEYIGGSCFYASTIEELNLPKSLTYLGNAAMQNSPLKVPLIVPKGLTTLNNGVFGGPAKFSPYISFFDHEVVPTMTNVNVFSGLACNIYVPDALYDEWIVATNWATYASRIVKASEFVEPTNN